MQQKQMSNSNIKQAAIFKQSTYEADTKTHRNIDTKTPVEINIDRRKVLLKNVVTFPLAKQTGLPQQLPRSQSGKKKKIPTIVKRRPKNAVDHRRKTLLKNAIVTFPLAKQTGCP